MLPSLRIICVDPAIFALSSIVAVLGYWLEGWSLLEAVYMVTIIIDGVGYGEVRHIDDPALRIFTTGVIIAGCTSPIYVLLNGCMIVQYCLRRWQTIRSSVRFR